MNSSILHSTSLVLLLACLVLFTQIIGSSVAQTLGFNFLQGPNMVTVNCQDVGSVITFSLTNLDGTPGGTFPGPSHTFPITPETETSVSCRGSNTQWSDPVTFAGDEN